MKLNRVNRIAVTAVTALMLFGSIAQPAMTAYAAEAQSPRWEGQGDFWRVKTEDGKGYMTNTWFQDLDGSWYLLGADGYMYSGLVTDQKTGCSYLLETNHNGHFGRMLFTNGAYTINGKQVTLAFNNVNPADATYGAIKGGLSELRATGVREVTKGTDGAVASEQNTGTTANTGHWYDKYMKADGTMDFARMTREEQEAYIEEIEGVTVGHLGGLDIEAAQEAANRLNRQQAQTNSNNTGSNGSSGRSGKDAWANKEIKPGVYYVPNLNN